MGESMIYYGGNDYRDYLAHYGVLGMHWGIRRYQPYSVKPRGSGKTGKEIGEAALIVDIYPAKEKKFNTKKLNTKNASLAITDILESNRLQKIAFADRGKLTVAVKTYNEINKDYKPSRTNSDFEKAILDDKLQDECRKIVDRPFNKQGKYITACENYIRSTGDTHVKLVKEKQRVLDSAQEIAEKAYLNEQSMISRMSKDTKLRAWAYADDLIRKSKAYKLLESTYKKVCKKYGLWDIDELRKSAVLRELGYPDTKDNRKAGFPFIPDSPEYQLSDAPSLKFTGKDTSNKKAAQYFKQHEIEDTKENRDKFEQLQRDIDKASEDYRNYLSVLKENDAAVKRGVASAEHNIYKDELLRAKDRLDSWQKHASYETAKYNNKIEYKHAYDYSNTSQRDIKYDLEHYGVALTPKNIEAYTAAKEKAKTAYDKYDMYWKTQDDPKELDRLWKEYDKAEKARKNLLKSSSSKASGNSTYGSSHKDTKSSASATKQQRSRARALKSSGYSYAEIAKRLGISEGAVSYYLNS